MDKLLGLLSHLKSVIDVSLLLDGRLIQKDCPATTKLTEPHGLIQWQIQGENPDMAPIQFDYRLCPPPNKEINKRYWETY